MDLAVFLVVLLSAAMQAAWNIILKIRLDPFSALVLVGLGAGAAALPFALWIGPPDRQLWPWIGASVVAHLSYYAFLIGAYSRADLGLTYPVARGSALLLTALISILVLSEPIGLIGVIGIVLLALAILTMAREAFGHMMEGRALLLALGSGLAVTAFTVIDGTAARISGSANAYTTWLFVCDAVVIVIIVLAWKGPRVLVPMAGFLPLGLLGGAMLFVSYWLSVWAMTQAPIGLVTAVRESSVLFGAIMSVAILREPLRTDRIIGAFMVIGGLTLIKLH
ncbi:DMT family transporter [Ancylobacter amanitiformis]|uniref:Drug/metabolite transporter (DMT)-like permease n=1 Tax=Ancylobacter amanitiformis TaxID=217069 RepID=A0ABU0LM93_9HYPH|nr:DMT family transporter [Ancylobacter amanitiformis]MDQ0509816.1 drug/metabolite transporter (DMT)-like permease [Ancylobacter amanitiformis]